MEYQYRTQIVWSWTNEVLPELLQWMDDQAALMATQNKTDGVLTYDGPARVRNWVTLEDAQSWVNCGSSLQGITIHSAEIVSNA